MTSVFNDTAAEGSDQESILGGSCYVFDTEVSGLSIDDTTLNLLHVLCFNSKPIITNDVPDYPFPTPPPVTTGCYPVRATASTTVDPDSPEGLSVSVSNNNPSCFPIINLTLNTQPILDQVLSLLTPSITYIGGDAHSFNILERGCCCDDLGNIYRGNSEGAGPAYSGLQRDCIGVDMGTGAGPLPDYPGIGIRWDNYSENGSDPSNCTGLYEKCCAAALAKWISPQVLGVARVEGFSEVIGQEYYVQLYSSGKSWDFGDNILYSYNVMELTEGLCDDDRFMPGVNTTESAPPVYPGDFSPQKVCQGSFVVVYAQLSAYNDIVPSSDWVPAGLSSADCGTESFSVWFQQALAHDSTCDTDGLASGLVSGEDYYRSLLDSPAKLSPEQLKALNQPDLSKPPHRGRERLRRRGPKSNG